MEETDISPDTAPVISRRCVGRAALKGLVVGCVIGALATFFILFARARVVNGLVNHLTLGLLVVMVIVINLVSLGLGLISFLAYKWIKRDLAPGNGEDEQE